MSSQDDDQQGLVLWVVFGLVALVIALVVGVSVYQRGKMSAAPKAGGVTASLGSAAALRSTATPVADRQAMADAASVKIENGVVKFYFASGKTDLAQGANAALTDVVKGANAGKKLVISGYHDATGSAAANAEIAKKRAFAVRDALKSAGVTDDKIELRKPEELKAAGNSAAARRVEVALR